MNTPPKTKIKQPVVVACTQAYHPGWERMASGLTAEQVQWLFTDDRPRWFWERFVMRQRLCQIRASIHAVYRAATRDADLLITVGPYVTGWCALFCRLFRIRVPHYADVFNFTVLPTGMRRRLMRYAYRSVSRFSVHSQMEIDLYSRYFDIPPDRLRLRLWGIGVPDTSPDTPLQAGRYVSSIGGNTRDYRTLIEACRLLPDIPFVLVVRPESLLGLDVPANVRTFVNLPFEQTMNVMLHSAFTVLPLAASTTPCGHVTLVCAMHLGKTVVATDSSGISDYVLPGFNGVVCEASSAASMAAAIAKLWADPEETATLADNNRRFGAEHCTEGHTRRDLAATLAAFGIPLRDEAAEPMGKANL